MWEPDSRREKRGCGSPARFLLVRRPRRRLECLVAMGRYLREGWSSAIANTDTVSSFDVTFCGSRQGSPSLSSEMLSSLTGPRIRVWLPRAHPAPTSWNFPPFLFSVPLHPPERWLLVTTLYRHWASERTFEKRCRRLCSPSLPAEPEPLWPSSSFVFSGVLRLPISSSCS